MTTDRSTPTTQPLGSRRSPREGGGYSRVSDAERDARLAAIYASVPSAECKGLCQDSCGPLPMTVHEARRLRRSGKPIPHEDEAVVTLAATGSYVCPALVDGRCSIYEMRPLICRLYGAVDHPALRCPHGCAPADGFLSAERAAELIEDAVAAGGGQR